MVTKTEKEFIELYEDFIRVNNIKKIYEGEEKKIKAEKDIAALIKKHYGEEINIVTNTETERKIIAYSKILENIKNKLVDYTSENLEELINNIKDKKEMISLASIIKSDPKEKNLEKIKDYKKYTEMYFNLKEKKEEALKKYEKEFLKIIREDIEKYSKDKKYVEDAVKIVYILSGLDKTYHERKLEKKIEEIEKELEKVNEKQIKSYIVSQAKSEEDYLNLANMLYLILNK